MQQATPQTEALEGSVALPESEWEHFSERLLDAPEPTPALRVAASAYRKNSQVRGNVTEVDERGWLEDLCAHPEIMLDP